MSCHSTTRAQEDPYAFTESAPLQANSLAYANHSSAISNSSSSSSSSTNNNASTTTTTNSTTTIQTASSGASLLLPTNTAGSVAASKDKAVSIPVTAVTSSATLKVRYNGVVTTASPTGTAVVRAPIGTTIPVFTKPIQIKQQSQQQGNLAGQPSPTVTVGKLIKKVLPQQKTPMITTVVAGGAKIISRLQQPNQTSAGQQLATTGGSILKFIKIPPQQLGKGGVVGGVGGLPAGSFIHVTTSSDGARKLLVTNSSSSNGNGVSPPISVATSSARIATAGTVNAVNRNASGMAMASNVSTVSPTKIRLIQPQAQGKIYLQATNSGTTLGTTAAHLSNPVTIATLRNTLIKQHQLQQQQQQQQEQQQQQVLQQKPSPQQQQHTPPSPKQQQITSQPVQLQQKQPQQQPQPIQKQQKAQQLKPQSLAINQLSPQPLPHTLPKTSSPSADGTQKPLPKPQLHACTVQSQSQQQLQAVPKTLLQSTPNGQKQSLLLQQQPPPKAAPSPTIQASTAPAKLQSPQQQPQSLLLQPQRKQHQPTGSSGNKQMTVSQQQSPKPANASAPISLLTSSANSPKAGSLLTKDSTRTSPVSTKEENDTKIVDPNGSVCRSANQQSLLLVGSNVEALANSPKSIDQIPHGVNRIDKIPRSPSSTTPVEPAASSLVGNKQSVTDASSSSIHIVRTEEMVTQEAKPAIATIKEEELTPPETTNGKVRAMSDRKLAVSGKSAGKQMQKSSKRTHSQHLMEEQEQEQGQASPPADNIGTLPSCTTSTPKASENNNSLSPSARTLLLSSSVKLEKEFEIKQEVEEQDEKPSKQRFVASGTVPGAIAVPIKRPKIKEWHAPGAYLFDLKDPDDESDDDNTYDEYPNTLSCWYEESIEITVPESSSSCWGLTPIHRSPASSNGSVRGGKGKSFNSRRACSGKFNIRMLSRDERLELKKAYLQRRVVQCRNGLRMRSAAASTARKRLESMAKMVAKLDERRQIELNKASEKAICISEGCNKSALVMTSHCYDHITDDPDQCLFQRCTAKFSDNSQCRVPVFDISHELILCKEHAWKHDNHDKMSLEVKLHKKPPVNVSQTAIELPTAIAGRKKAKPIQPPSPQVVVRSLKRPKKKKKLTPLQQQMLLHQQQYKQQFSITYPTHLAGQAAVATSPANEPQRKVVQQPQKSLLNTSRINGNVQVQLKQGMMPLQKESIVAHPGQQQRIQLIDGSENPHKTATFNTSILHTATQGNRTLHIPAAVGSNLSAASGLTGTTVYRGQHNNTSSMEIVDQLEHDQEQHQPLYSNGTHTSPPNTQELLTICDNSSAYASSEDTGVGGLSESELLATQDVIEEIIPFEFSNLLHPNMLSHLPPDALNDLLGLDDDVPAEDDTGDSHQSCPREVEDDIERALEHVKSLDDMTVEPSSLLGDFLDNVDDEMLDGSDMCATTEQMLQTPNKTNDIRGMVHT